jgi:hypothetical protein
MTGLSTLPLPHGTARLSSAGFKKLYENVRADPALAKVIADEIEADPRGMLERVFRLTKAQQAAIGNASDAELRKRAHALLTELRSGEPKPLQFHPNGEAKPDYDPGRNRILSCTCFIG